MPAEAGDEVLVCDLSMQRNHSALLHLLRGGREWCATSTITRSTQVPQHAALEACIDFDPRVCTSLLIDRLLHGRFRAWALVGAYGDNLTHVADALAADMGLDEPAARSCASWAKASTTTPMATRPATSTSRRSACTRGSRAMRTART